MGTLKKKNLKEKKGNLKKIVQTIRKWKPYKNKVQKREKERENPKKREIKRKEVKRGGK